MNIQHKEAQFHVRTRKSSRTLRSEKGDSKKVYLLPEIWWPSSAPTDWREVRVRSWVCRAAVRGLCWCRHRPGSFRETSCSRTSAKRAVSCHPGPCDASCMSWRRRVVARTPDGLRCGWLWRCPPGRLWSRRWRRRWDSSRSWRCICARATTKETPGQSTLWPLILSPRGLSMRLCFILFFFTFTFTFRFSDGRAAPPEPSSFCYLFFLSHILRLFELYFYLYSFLNDVALVENISVDCLFMYIGIMIEIVCK